MSNNILDPLGFHNTSQINSNNINKYVKIIGDNFLKNIINKKLQENVSVKD